VNAVIHFAVVGLLILNGVSPAEAKKKSRPKTNRVKKVQIEAATRLQVSSIAQTLAQAGSTVATTLLHGRRLRFTANR
jgi:hypothetical protein